MYCDKMTERETLCLNHLNRTILVIMGKIYLIKRTISEIEMISS